MSVTIKKLNETFDQVGADWNWQFTYAPKPGQQRIKITAINRKDTAQVKVIVLAEDLFKKLPIDDVAKNVIRLLPNIPNSAAEPVRIEPLAPVAIKRAAALSAGKQYQQLRQSYRRHVTDLQPRAGVFPSEGDWTTTFSRSVTRFFAGVSKKLAQTN